MRPRILALSSDQPELAPLLERRFGRDFDIAIADDLGQAGHHLNSDAPTALVIASHRASGHDTLPLLATLRDRSPHTLRCLLVPRVDGRQAAEHAAAAMAVDGLDDFLQVPWGHPDVTLYPPVTDLLARWRRRTEPEQGEVVLIDIIGPERSPRCHDLRDLAARNNLPNRFLDTDSTAAHDILRRLGLDEVDRPVVVLPGGQALVDPTNLEIAQHLGADTRPLSDLVDVAIVGGGPGGLAAAVYSGSEGLDTVVIERHAIGGQAGTSAQIRNYLGFPHGLSGSELAARAGEQAWLFGVQFVHTNGVTALSPATGGRWQLDLEDGATVEARSVVLATGVTYRRLTAPGLDELAGAGVFYGAATSEAPAMTGKRVFVVGAGNSAGQAAIHLARYAKQVTVLARGADLSASMSDYLINDLLRTHNITIRFGTEIVAADGERGLERLVLANRTDDLIEEVEADGLFILIGAEPRTDWLPAALQRDPHGFIRTGRDLTPRPGNAPEPLAFETNLPGVFAIGDVRAGSVKRVASAVGEGSVCISQIHQHLNRRTAALRARP